MGADQRLDGEGLGERGIARHALRGALRANGAVREQDEPVAKACGQRKIVQHDKRGNAAARASAQELHRLQLMIGIERGHGLVREQHGCLARQRPREKHARALARRQRGDAARREGRHIGGRERALDRLAIAGVKRGKGFPEGQAAEHHHVAHGHGPSEHRVLRHVGDVARERAAAELRQRLAVEAHRAFVRTQEPREHAHERRLARAVGADKPGERSRFHRERDAGQHAPAVERQRDIFGEKARHAACSLKHEPEEEGRADERGGDPQHQLAAGAAAPSKPDADIGGGQQKRAAERPGQHEPARPVGHERAQDMRRHEPDETDRARDRDRGADRERGAQNDPQAERLEIDAEARRRLLAQRQRIEPARGAREKHEARENEGHARAARRSCSCP